MQEIVEWLMEGPAWVRYRCLRDLLDMKEENQTVQTAGNEMLSDPQILKFIADLGEWESTPLKRHNDGCPPPAQAGVF